MHGHATEIVVFIVVVVYIASPIDTFDIDFVVPKAFASDLLSEVDVVHPILREFAEPFAHHRKAKIRQA